MTATKPGRAHVIAGGFPPGSYAGHDHDYARLRLLGLLAEQDIPVSVGNDFADVEKWLPISGLLITYVAGPYPDAAQSRAIRSWLEAGGQWLGLHGTSGGRAERVEGSRQRRTVKSEHHALLGGYFLTHPPICKIRVEVRDPDHPLTRGLGSSFEVEDEPYFVELQDPGATRVLLTADYGPDAVSPAIGTLYASDTSLQPDGKTRVLGYTRELGKGSVTYLLSAIATTPRSVPPEPPTRRTRRRPPSTARGRPRGSTRCCATRSPGACVPDRSGRRSLMSERYDVAYLVLSGSTTAARCPELLRGLVELGFSTVIALPTPNASRVVALRELADIEGVQVVQSYFDLAIRPRPPRGVVLFAPCSFNSLNKLAHGTADNLALSVAAEAIGRGTPVIVGPSLNAPLLAHPVAQASLRTLPSWRVIIVPPVDEGEGPRLAPSAQLLAAVRPFSPRRL